MIDEWFTSAIAIVVSDFFTFFDIFFGDEHEMRLIFVCNDFRHQITVAWMVHQTTEFSTFGRSVDAKITEWMENW